MVTDTTSATVARVYVEILPDEDGDASWLEQTPAQLGSLEAAVWNRRRLMALHAGEWTFVGIRAVVDVEIMDTRRGTVLNSFRVTSPGLWGVESDSGEDYFRLIGAEEIGELVDDLSAIGLTLDDGDDFELVYR